jgi:hypothetical protein
MADIKKMQGLYDAIGVVQPGVSWVTGDGMAQRVVESAHARAMAEEARALAAQCRQTRCSGFRLNMTLKRLCGLRKAWRGGWCISG